MDTTRSFKEASKQDGETPSSYTPREIVKSSHTAVCRVLNPAESDNKGAFTGMVHDAYMSSRVDKQDHSKQTPSTCMHGKPKWQMIGV